MTKSQNTKNEQHCIKQNEKSFTQKDLYKMKYKQNSNDLTEQWKKGELLEGHYYVKDGENMIAEYLDGYFYNNGEPMTSFSGGVDEVLAPVPSFEEWKAKLEENARLKEQINHLLKTQARQFVDNQKLQVKAEKAKDVVNIDTARQIKQLKELLKECRPYVNRRLMETRERLNKPYTATDNVLHKKAEKLITKIDEALR